MPYAYPYASSPEPFAYPYVSSPEDRPEAWSARAVILYAGPAVAAQTDFSLLLRFVRLLEVLGGGLHEVGRRPVGQPVGGLGGPRLVVSGGLGSPAEPLLGRWSATLPMCCALLSPLPGKLPGLSLHAGDEAAGDILDRKLSSPMASFG